MHSNLAEVYFLCYIFANEAKKKLSATAVIYRLLYPINLELGVTKRLGKFCFTTKLVLNFLNYKDKIFCFRKQKTLAD